jgi:hypothetical protein
MMEGRSQAVWASRQSLPCIPLPFSYGAGSARLAGAPRHIFPPMGWQHLPPNGLAATLAPSPCYHLELLGGALSVAWLWPWAVPVPATIPRAAPSIACRPSACLCLHSRCRASASP